MLDNFAIVSSSFTNKMIFYKAFNWPILPVDQIAIFKLINSPLNSDLLYYKLVDMVKLSIRHKINKSNSVCKCDLIFEGNIN